MNIMLVEDNEIKLDKIAEFLKQELPNIIITKACSYSTAVKSLKNTNFDLIILDMSLPSFDKKGLENGGRTRTFGGKEIASQMKRRNIITPFLVITQYDGFTFGDKFIKISDLNDELKNIYTTQFLGIIHFDAINNSWRHELYSIISTMLEK